MKWLLVLMLSSSMADLASTEMALSRHDAAYEANPLMQNQGVRIAAKLTIPVGIYFATSKMSRKKRILFCVLASSVWASFATRNLYLMYTHSL